jgi:hypothetical protein
MTNIVISQPMFFPWIGLFEQIRLSDVYVHYDDVQFSKGSFVNRVEIKTPEGYKWLTVPLENLKLGQEIREVKISEKKEWRKKHLQFLKQTYEEAPFCEDMVQIVENVYSHSDVTISELSVKSIISICEYLGFDQHRRFLYSSNLNMEGKGSQRVLDIVQFLNGQTYITGHGARNYLDHKSFETKGIQVEYMDYKKIPYPQLYGEFNPYVSTLDLIANVGKDASRYIVSGTINWMEFIHG